MKNIFTRIAACLLIAGIITACKKEIDTDQYMRVVAVSDFTATIQAPNNLTVKLSNKSKNAKRLSWDFGDNSPVSTETAPTHTYAEPGKYTITLTIESSTGNESVKTLAVTVTPVDIIPEINFLYA